MGGATIYRRFNGKAAKGIIYHGDALAFLGGMHRGVADVIFLDPPFNLGKKYGDGAPTDSLREADYELWLLRMLSESVRVLREGGALFVYHLPRWAYKIASALDQHLMFRHWIAVSMKNGFVRGDRLYPAHYALLYFTKGDPGAFFRPTILPATCRHCGGYIKDYGGYKHIIDGRGINLSDVWDDISPVRHRSTKTRGANELPPKLVKRVLEIASRPAGLFVDPFCGSGSTVVEAVKHDMRFRACDIMEDNCKLTIERVQKSKTEPRGVTEWQTGQTLNRLSASSCTC